MAPVTVTTFAGAVGKKSPSQRTGDACKGGRHAKRPRMSMQQPCEFARGEKPIMRTVERLEEPAAEEPRRASDINLEGGELLACFDETTR